MARVMVVEDEALVAADLAATLEELGHEVVATAATGAQAIQRAMESRPDILLMDVHLRGAMDGIDAATVLRRRLGVPVVLLTAYADAATRARADQIAPAAYLLKPFDEAQVAAALSLATPAPERDSRTYGAG